MALSIRNSETESLAVAAARLAGETGTEAVSRALRERLQRLLADLQPLTGHLTGHLVVTGAVAYDDYRPQCGRGLASAETGGLYDRHLRLIALQCGRGLASAETFQALYTR